MKFAVGRVINLITDLVAEEPWGRIRAWSAWTITKAAVSVPAPCKISKLLLAYISKLLVMCDWSIW